VGGQLSKNEPVQQYCGVLKAAQALLHPSATLNSAGHFEFMSLLHLTFVH
jgi:hypothetical protein